MKIIKISKSNRLYRLFDYLQKSEYYSFIHREYDGEGGSRINSFNCVCTFVKHCGLIVLSTLMYAIIVLSLLCFAFVLCFIFFGTMYVSAHDIFNKQFSMFSSVVVVFPLILYVNYRYNLSRQHQLDVVTGEDSQTMISKFVEIVSSKSSKYCVKIDVIEPEALKKANSETVEDKKD